MGEQEPGTVCAFTDEEYEDYFGSTRPTAPTGIASAMTPS
jgi:hypothetical protein